MAGLPYEPLWHVLVELISESICVRIHFCSLYPNSFLLVIIYCQRQAHNKNIPKNIVYIILSV